MLKIDLFPYKGIMSYMEVYSNRAKSFVPMDHCYLVPFRYLFTNTLSMAWPIN